MKTLVKMMFVFVFAFTIYLNNGDVITAKKVETKWTWCKVKEITQYKEKQTWTTSTSYKHLDIKKVKQMKIPVTSILRIEED